MNELEQEMELNAFLMASEPLGLTTDQLASILNVGAQLPVSERDVFKVLEGARAVPNVWWPRLRAYDRRVKNRQTVLALEQAGNMFGHLQQGVFNVDFDSALDRDAAGRAIRSLPDRSRAFVAPTAFWEQLKHRGR